jgi:hypothetical protein
MPITAQHGTAGRQRQAAHNLLVVVVELADAVQRSGQLVGVVGGNLREQAGRLWAWRAVGRAGNGSGGGNISISASQHLGASSSRHLQWRLHEALLAGWGAGQPGTAEGSRAGKAADRRKRQQGCWLQQLPGGAAQGALAAGSRQQAAGSGQRAAGSGQQAAARSPQLAARSLQPAAQQQQRRPVTCEAIQPYSSAMSSS